MEFASAPGYNQQRRAFPARCIPALVCLTTSQRRFLCHLRGLIDLNLKISRQRQIDQIRLGHAAVQCCLNVWGQVIDHLPAQDHAFLFFWFVPPCHRPLQRADLLGAKQHAGRECFGCHCVTPPFLQLLIHQYGNLCQADNKKAHSGEWAISYENILIGACFPEPSYICLQPFLLNHH